MTSLSPSICELIGQFKRHSSLIGIYASLASSPFQTAGSKGRKEIIFVDQRKILRKKAYTNLGLQQDTSQCLSVTNCALTHSTVALIAAKIFPSLRGSNIIYFI